MSRGRPPKPTRLKIVNGNPGKRQLPAAEPRPAPGAPECPAWLDPEAQAEWQRVVVDLDRIGLLCRVDRATVAAYCQAWAEFHAATRLLQEAGRTITTGGKTITSPKGAVTETEGQLQPHPAVSMQRSAWTAIKSFSSLFGLDPSSRSRIHVPPAAQDEEDPMNEFIA